MGLFDRIFRKWRRDTDASSRMQLSLKHPPTPEYAARHAQLAVDAARDVEGVDLDYTPSSLDEVDRIILRFHAEGVSSERIGATIFSFGCYTGEVMVRTAKCLWKMPADTNLPANLKDGINFMVIEFQNGDVCNPIGKAFKLLENGEEDSLSYFYRVFVPTT